MLETIDSALCKALQKAMGNFPQLTKEIHQMTTTDFNGKTTATAAEIDYERQTVAMLMGVSDTQVDNYFQGLQECYPWRQFTLPDGKYPRSLVTELYDYQQAIAYKIPAQRWQESPRMIANSHRIGKGNYKAQCLAKKGRSANEEIQTTQFEREADAQHSASSAIVTAGSQVGASMMKLGEKIEDKTANQIEQVIVERGSAGYAKGAQRGLERLQSIFEDIVDAL